MFFFSLRPARYFRGLRVCSFFGVVSLRVTLRLLAMRTRKQRKNGAINHTVDTLFSSLSGMFRGFSRALSNISLLTEIICLDWLLVLSCSEREVVNFWTLFICLFAEFFLSIIPLESENSSSGCDCTVISFDLFLKHSAGRYQTRVCALSGLTHSHAQFPSRAVFWTIKCIKLLSRSSLDLGSSCSSFSWTLFGRFSKACLPYSLLILLPSINNRHVLLEMSNFLLPFFSRRTNFLAKCPFSIIFTNYLN